MEQNKKNIIYSIIISFIFLFSIIFLGHNDIKVPSWTLLTEGTSTNKTIELGSNITITVSHTAPIEYLCLDVDDLLYGKNYTCITTSATTYTFGFRPDAVSLNKFNDSSIAKNLSITSNGYLKITNSWELKNFTFIAKGYADSGIYPYNLSIDICNDSNKEIILPGYLKGSILTQTNFSTLQSNITFTNAPSIAKKYLEIPRYFYDGNELRFTFIPSIYFFAYTEYFNTTEFKDSTLTNAVWNTTSHQAHMELNQYLNYTGYGGTYRGYGADSFSVLNQYNVSHALDNNTVTAYISNASRTATGSGTYITYHFVTSVKNNKNGTTVPLTYYLKAWKTGGTSSSSMSTYLLVYDNDIADWVQLDGVSVTGSGASSSETSNPKSLDFDLDNKYYNTTDNTTRFAILYFGLRDGTSATYAGEAKIYDGFDVGMPMNGYANYPQNIVSKTLYTPASNITSMVINSTATVPTGTNITLQLTADGGTNWEEVNLLNQQVTHTFANQGKDLRFKLIFTSTNSNFTANVSKIVFPNPIGTTYPENISIDIGGDGTIDYQNFTKINTTLIVNLSEESNSPVSAFLSKCKTETCLLPIYFYSATRGVLDAKIINYTTYGLDKINASVSCFNNCTTQYCTYPITVNDNYVELSNLKLTYLGGKNISLSAHNKNYTLISNLTAMIYFSNWDFSFPSRVYGMEFTPSSPTRKNVTPRGQNRNVPIFNITTKNNDSLNMNFSIYLSESYSCVNLTMSTTENKSQGSLLANNTWTAFATNKAAGYNFGIWVWADYNCNFTTWKLWQPQLELRGCCKDCVCDRSII